MKGLVGLRLRAVPTGEAATSPPINDYVVLFG